MELKKFFPVKSLGMGAIVLGCLIACSTGKITTVNTANNNGNNSAKEKTDYILHSFSQIEGTEFLMAPVYLDGKEESRGGLFSSKEYSKTESPVKNYFFFDRNKLSTTKLFPNNQVRILNVEKIGESTQIKDGDNRESTVLTKVSTLWYEIVKVDTNSNQNLDHGDRITIGISDPAGKNYQELVKDIDRILNVHAKSKEVRILFYQSGNKYFAAEINLVTRRVKNQELPSVHE